MKIVWRSPWGDGWSIAYKLRELGHKVVYCGPDKNKPGHLSGQGYLPTVMTDAWVGYANKADLVVVDGNWPSRQTRRSWSPSDEVLELQQLRRRGVPLLGPSPTTELLEHDERYLRKMLVRLGIRSVAAPGPEVSGQTLASQQIATTLSRDPAGNTYLVFRHRHLLSELNGPEFGNLGDVSIPIADTNPLICKTLNLLHPLIERGALSGYLNADVVIHQGHVELNRLQARFIYPAVFTQLATLLGKRELPQIGIAVTLLSLKEHQVDVIEDLTQQPGFYGAEVHRDVKSGDASVVHGAFVGATVSTGADLPFVREKINSQLSAHLRDGWGFRTDVGVTVAHKIDLLKEWGYLK